MEMTVVINDMHDDIQVCRSLHTGPSPDVHVEAQFRYIAGDDIF